MLGTFVFENAIPLVNFGVLMAVLYWIQAVRRDLKNRLARFERIDAQLEALRKDVHNGQP